MGIYSCVVADLVRPRAVTLDSLRDWRPAMPDINNLASRIDAEFTAVEQKVKKFQSEQAEQHKQRGRRLEQLSKVFDDLRDIWRPRLEFLVKKFGDRVQATPRIVPSSREATLDFQSRLARVRLKLSALTDRDIQKVVLSYDLEIIPVLMRFKNHDEIEFPLDRVDKEAVAKWIDDRIVDFVQTYFSMGENEIYLKDEMVEDPIAQVRFPKAAAATSLEWSGRKYYFIGEETRREFEKQQGIGSK
jgi:YHS domain-containing protein